MTDESLTIYTKHPLNMLNDLNTQNPVFTANRVIMFLSGIDCSIKSVASKINRNKVIEFQHRQYIFDRCLNILQEIEDDEGEKFIVKILKIYYDSPGNYFLIQVIKSSRYLQYHKESFESLEGRKYQTWVFDPIPFNQHLVNNPR